MSEAETPAFRYTAALANQIEKRWQDYWSARGTSHAPNPVGPLADPAHPRSGAPKKFVLDMFPYPSGAGLHVGHPLGFIGTDVFARFNRMAGHNVLHTMGFDAFGLPAEQYAVQTGTHPRVTTEQNVERYRAQLRMLGLGHDERRGGISCRSSTRGTTPKPAAPDPSPSWKRPSPPVSGPRRTAGPGRRCPPPSSGRSSTTTGWRTCRTRRSTGARGWAPTERAASDCRPCPAPPRQHPAPPGRRRR